MVGGYGFRFGGGQSSPVGWVVGFGARWVLRPSQLVVLSVHGGLRAGGLGWRAVVVVFGLLVEVVEEVVVVVVLVGAVVRVLRVSPQDPLALWRDKEVWRHLQPLRLQGCGG